MKKTKENLQSKRAIKKLNSWRANEARYGRREICTHLISRCGEDPELAKGVLRKGKTWESCMCFIWEKARKYKNGMIACVDAAVVFGWAEEYFTLTA